MASDIIDSTKERMLNIMAFFLSGGDVGAGLPVDHRRTGQGSQGEGVKDLLSPDSRSIFP